MRRNLASALKNLAEGKFNWRSEASPVAAPLHSVGARGVSLEIIFKDILCRVTNTRIANRTSLYRKYLAYVGGQRNPPDAIFRGGDKGDAFEVKKVSGRKPFQLNSSFPHTRLEKGGPRLTKEVNDCEPKMKWKARALFYVVGDIETGRSRGNWLWIVEGQVMAQETSFYEQYENKVRKILLTATNSKGYIQTSTKELGSFPGVDKLGRTKLRVRGMWVLKNPRTLFENDLNVKINAGIHCTIITLMSEDKWNQLLSDRTESERKFWERDTPTMTIEDCIVREPDDKRRKLKCKLIRISIS